MSEIDAVEAALLPCPFCGDPCESPCFRPSFGQWQMICGCCETQGPLCPTKERASATWNTRNGGLAQAREAETLRDRVRVLEAHLTEAIERVEKGDLAERMCCDGHMCGCYGSTNADQFLYFARAALDPSHAR